MFQGWQRMAPFSSPLPPSLNFKWSTSIWFDPRLHIWCTWQSRAPIHIHVWNVSDQIWLPFLCTSKTNPIWHTFWMYQFLATQMGVEFKGSIQFSCPDSNCAICMVHEQSMMVTVRGDCIEDELKQVCYGVLHVSQDPCLGNGQQAENFWGQSEEHYEKQKPKDAKMRGTKSIKGTWMANHVFSKFIHCYQQLHARQMLGTNKANTLWATKEL